MSIVSGLAIYFIIWWMVLFTILPFGVTSQKDAGDVILGTEHGAPIRSRVRLKMLTTTIVSLIIFGGLYYARFELGLGLDDVPLLPRF
ncbi:MAG: hypothetical protein COA52_20050 [Hyphomicrobiales bacterium]|nr:MAG: hypothetical protein COA52_20050 [Hyphomicrobiales bacterium]